MTNGTKNAIKYGIAVIVDALPAYWLGEYLLDWFRGTHAARPVIADLVSKIADWVTPLSHGLEPGITAQEPPITLVGAVLTVLIMFFAATLVLTFLKPLDRKLEAKVEGEIPLSEGNIKIEAAGLVGAFIAIVVVGVTAVYFLTRS